MGLVSAPAFNLAVAVASPAGTVTVAYPAGLAQADFTGDNASGLAVVVVNDNDVYKEVDDKVDVSYGGSNITLTNKSGSTWPAGAKVLAGFARAEPIDEFIQADAIANVGGTLTGAVDGTMADCGGTYTAAEVNLNFKELQAKVNAILTGLRSAGVLASS